METPHFGAAHPPPDEASTSLEIPHSGANHALAHEAATAAGIPHPGPRKLVHFRTVDAHQLQQTIQPARHPKSASKLPAFLPNLL
jgi:hypothetical protein